MPPAARSTTACLRPLPAQPCSAELVLDDLPSVVQPATHARNTRRVAALHEWRPERWAGECRLDIRQQLVDRLPVLGLFPADVGHQPLERVTQMPLAQIQLGLREASANGVREAVVAVAHDP